MLHDGAQTQAVLHGSVRASCFLVHVEVMIVCRVHPPVSVVQLVIEHRLRESAIVRQLTQVQSTADLATEDGAQGALLVGHAHGSASRHHWLHGLADVGTGDLGAVSDENKRAASDWVRAHDGQAVGDLLGAPSVRELPDRTQLTASHRVGRVVDLARLCARRVGLSREERQAEHLGVDGASQTGEVRLDAEVRSARVVPKLDPASHTLRVEARHGMPEVVGGLASAEEGEQQKNNDGLHFDF